MKTGLIVFFGTALIGINLCWLGRAEPIDTTAGDFKAAQREYAKTLLKIAEEQMVLEKRHEVDANDPFAALAPRKAKFAKAWLDALDGNTESQSPEEVVAEMALDFANHEYAVAVKLNERAPTSETKEDITRKGFAVEIAQARLKMAKLEECIYSGKNAMVLDANHRMAFILAHRGLMRPG